MSESVNRRRTDGCWVESHPISSPRAFKMHIKKFQKKMINKICVPRAATIQLPHDTIHITIFASRYDMYRDTFLAT